MAADARSEPVQDETYLPREDDAEIIDFLSALRERGRLPADAPPRLVGPDGHSVELSESMFQVLLQVAAAMKAGLAVTVAPHHLTLSTQEAADLLRISRTTLVRLLESGVIPFEKPSRHRKVRLDDLLDYRKRQRSQAEQALADMVADAERLGLYDMDPAEVDAAVRAARRSSKAELACSARCWTPASWCPAGPATSSLRSPALVPTGRYGVRRSLASLIARYVGSCLSGARHRRRRMPT